MVTLMRNLPYEFPDENDCGLIIHAARYYKEIGKKTQQVIKQEYDLAWLHHIHCNPHHWKYFMLYEEGDESGLKLFEMPEIYVKEMIADWIGAGIAITGKREVGQWYLKNKDKMMLHKNTRDRIENELLFNNID